MPEIVGRLYVQHKFSREANQEHNQLTREMLKLRQPYDKADWIVGSAVVNAFYNPSNNEMVYPSGTLQGVFCQHRLPRSVKFGAIGMVVGHEMTHGFDDSGDWYEEVQ
ncbi:membrane metallo-endopeptidase-like 1 [Amblyomma americanum]